MSTEVVVVVGVLLVVVVLVLIVVGRRREEEQHRAAAAGLSAWAAGNGWRYVDRDPALDGRFLGSPVHGGFGDPFGTRVGGRCEHALIGAHRGREVFAGEYTYRVSSHSGQQTHTRSYTYTVVGIRTPAPRPMLQISRESGVGRLVGGLETRRVQLGSPAFDHAFRVVADNDRFAHDVLAPPVQHWLLTDQRAAVLALRFESADLVCWRHGALTPPGMLGMADYVIDALDRVPAVVWQG